jgi:nicotinate-nucleotide--dimethylbenzimidazole phosphoribosyltransferase
MPGNSIMTEATLRSMLRSIVRPQRSTRAKVQAHLDELTKPRGSLGRLEQLAVRLALIYGDPPPPLRRRAVFVFAADHGVAAQGVSAYPSAVTAQMCNVLAGERAGINVIARCVQAQVHTIDVGVDGSANSSAVRQRVVRKGTRDLSLCAALERAEVLQAIAVGYEETRLQLDNLDLIGLGEVGIGNTTSAAALTAALTGAATAAVVGRGTGIDNAALQRKCSIVETALQRIDRDDPPDVLRVLAEFGGLEIAALVGAIVAAAQAGKAVVLDGFIATSAALAAVRLHAPIRHYLFAGHRSPEPGHAVQLRFLRLTPILRLRMRLGEGTGAALAFPILDAAGSLLREMATFADAAVARSHAEV